MRAHSSQRSKAVPSESPAMEKMAAAQLQRYGGPEVLELVEVPRPEPGAGEVLIAVEASSVNPHDAVVRSGTLKVVTGRRMPLGLGLDFTGTVVACGADAVVTSIGTPVWGMMSPTTGHRTGAAAQYVVVPTSRIAPMPTRLSMIEAAALVTSGTTALRALRDVAQLQAGERLLVRGGAGGVGSVAVQIGHALGAHVTALASSSDLEFLTGLGAHSVIDHRTVTPDQLEEFDVVLDTVGTQLLAHRRRLTRRGRMITIAFGSGPAMASIAASTVFGPKRIRTFSNYPNQRLLLDLAGLVDSGAVWPIIDTVYPLANISEAHRALGQPGRRGKLVLITATADHWTQ